MSIIVTPHTIGGNTRLMTWWGKKEMRNGTSAQIAAVPSTLPNASTNVSPEPIRDMIVLLAIGKVVKLQGGCSQCGWAGGLTSSFMTACQVSMQSQRLYKDPESVWAFRCSTGHAAKQPAPSRAQACTHLTPMTDRIPAPHWRLYGSGMPVTWTAGGGREVQERVGSRCGAREAGRQAGRWTGRRDKSWQETPPAYLDGGGDPADDQCGADKILLVVEGLGGGQCGVLCMLQEGRGGVEVRPLNGSRKVSSKALAHFGGIAADQV